MHAPGRLRHRNGPDPALSARGSTVSRVSTGTAAPPRRARVAVSVLFCVNGALIGSFLARLPAVKSELELSNAALGAGVAFGPAGALLASSVAGILVARVGSGRLAVASSATYGVLLPLIGLAPIWAAFAGAVFLLGICDGLADVSQNAHGLRVQHAYRRSVLNGFHAWWSIGGVLGGASAAGAAALGIPLAVHLAVAGAILATASLLAGRWTLPGTDPGADHMDEAGAAVPTRRSGGRALLALGGVAGVTLLAAFVEDVPGSWGAVYLHDALGTSAGVAGLAFAMLTAGMTVGRLVADRAVDRWGYVVVVRTGATVAAAGLAGALLIGHPVAGLAGFALVGLGAAPTFPALFHTAGHRRGVRPSDGIALVSWAARFGFLLAPPLVGVVADAVTLPWAVAIGSLAAAAVALAANTLRAR